MGVVFGIITFFGLIACLLGCGGAILKYLKREGKDKP